MKTHFFLVVINLAIVFGQGLQAFSRACIINDIMQSLVKNVSFFEVEIDAHTYLDMTIPNKYFTD